MSNPIIDAHIGSPDPSWHPQTFGEACGFLDQLISATLQGSYIPYVMGGTTPAVVDQDKVWLQLDSGGKPARFMKYYNGNWRPVYNGLFREIKMFVGNPAFAFDSTGRGIVGGPWDGWALCNGLNGTPNLTDFFLVGAHMDQSSGIPQFNNAGPVTGVNGTTTNKGGVRQTTLTTAQVPSDSHEEQRLDKFTADGNARSNTGLLLGHYSGTHDPDGSEAIVPAIPGNSDPDPVPTLPPYFAVFFVEFIGYE